MIGEGEENNAMVLNVLGPTRDDKSILSLLGKNNCENLICFDSKTGVINGAKYYESATWSMSMVSPDFKYICSPRMAGFKPHIREKKAKL